MNFTKIKTIFILILSFLLITNIPVLSQKSGFTCKVIKVKDGDTFKCKSGISIRVWGINTPELKSKLPEEKQRAYKAKEELTKKILNKTLYCIPKGASYSRIVAQCFMLNDLGKFILDNELGKEVIDFSNHYYSNRIIKLQSYKMLKNKGD